jgi:hypothetical protein
MHPITAAAVGRSGFIKRREGLCGARSPCFDGQSRLTSTRELHGAECATGRVHEQKADGEADVTASPAAGGSAKRTLRTRGSGRSAKKPKGGSCPLPLPLRLTPLS